MVPPSMWPAGMGVIARPWGRGRRWRRRNRRGRRRRMLYSRAGEELVHEDTEGPEVHRPVVALGITRSVPPINLIETSPSKMEETRMLTRETIFTGDNQ